VDEVEWVKKLHPDRDSYTHTYDHYKLLNEKTIMAHGIYINDEEMSILKARNTGVAHCPNSNFSIMSGVLNVRKLLDFGIKVGLGTDISGGYHPSVLDSVHQAITASKVTAFNSNDKSQLSHKEGFFLATLGGAQCVGLGDKIGNFIVGKYFDAVVVDTAVEGTPFDVFPGEKLFTAFEKFLWLGDDRNLVKIYVNGKEVFPFPNKSNMT